MTRTSPVGAVVLSTGEWFVERAKASLAAQTLVVDPIVIVENESPFSRALNQGAALMSAPWFVQVDADMILDPGCVAALLAHATPDTGVVVGELRDPLSTRAVGVKLFRTECFRHTSVPDTIGQDTDFVAALNRAGWRIIYVEERAPNGETVRPALGDHRPDYTPEYTYRKLIIEGRRLRHRGARHGLFHRMATLEEAGHPLATLAQLALGHGFFLRSDRDELRPADADPNAGRLVGLLTSDRETPDQVGRLRRIAAEASLGEIFRVFLGAGQAIALHHAGGSLRTVFGGLDGSRRHPRRLVAKVALAHGLLLDEDDHRHLASDERAFQQFMMFSLGPRSTALDHIRARIGRLLEARRHPASFVPW